MKVIKISFIDYLLKPIDIEELKRAAGKAHVKQGEADQKRQFETLLSNLSGSGVKRKICLATS